MQFRQVLSAILVMTVLTAGCEANGSTETNEADGRLRIFSIDYDANSHRAVFEVCRVGDPSMGERGRVCQLGWADLSAARESVSLVPVTRQQGVQYNSAVFSPGGGAVYASRRRIEDWRGHLYDSPSQIVRINLDDGVATVIANDDSGLLTVTDVAVAADGVEVLILLETLDSPRPERPSNGSRFRMLQVRNGAVVPGSNHDLDDIGGAGYELRIPGSGYVRQAEDRRADKPEAGFFAARPADVVRGRYQILPSLDAAVNYVTDCDGVDCASVAAQRAHAVARLMGGEARLSGPLPEAVIAAFPDRPPEYFPNANDPSGAYALGYDLSGGAVAVPRGPQPDPRRIPFTLMGGQDLPFGPRANGVIEVGAFASGWF